MKLLERRQVIVIAAAVGMVVLFSAAIYAPLARQNSLLKEARLSASEQNDQVRSQVQLIPATIREKQELREFVGDYEARIPRERNFAVVWEQLAEAMNEQGLSDQLIKPGAEIQGEDEIVCIPLSIEGRGQLSAIFGFFQSLEELERLIRVERLAISEDKDENGDLKMTASAKIFYQRAKTM